MSHPTSISHHSLLPFHITMATSLKAIASPEKTNKTESLGHTVPSPSSLVDTVARHHVGAPTAHPASTLPS
jgi:hypothetical protein